MSILYIRGELPYCVIPVLSCVVEIVLNSFIRSKLCFRKICREMVDSSSGWLCAGVKVEIDASRNTS